MPSNMKCFKIFFKHTWRPQQVAVKTMECTTGFRAGKECRNNDTELGELKVVQIDSDDAISSRPDRIPCRNGACKASRNQGEPRSESPWHFLKTVFLLSVIVAFILWLIVYAVLAQYDIL